MVQNATAPAAPAATRKVVRSSLQACLCAFGLQLAMTSALAESSAADMRNAGDVIDASLLRTAHLKSVPAELRFAPNDVNAEVMKVALQSVRVSPVAIPRGKPHIATPAVATAALATAPARSHKPTFLFRSKGKPVSLTPVTKRWQRALGALEEDTSRHGFKAYAAILDQVKNQRRGLQIPKVNYMVNRLLAYREDFRLWNEGEYWANPVESLTKRAGDCEDYAILKYTLLRDLGVKDEDMRIVVLRDTAARQYHAVLTVRHNGEWLILDNRFSRIRFERDLPNYQALYSVNAAGEWAHTSKSSTPVRLAARLKAAKQ